MAVRPHRVEVPGRVDGKTRPHITVVLVRAALVHGYGAPGQSTVTRGGHHDAVEAVVAWLARAVCHEDLVDGAAPVGGETEGVVKGGEIAGAAEGGGARRPVLDDADEQVSPILTGGKQDVPVEIPH